MESVGGGGGGVLGITRSLGTSLMINGYSAILLLYFRWIGLIYCKYCNSFSNFVFYNEIICKYCDVLTFQ